MPSIYRYICSMFSVESNYKLVNDLAGRNAGMYISPAAYNRWARLASNDRFKTLIGAKNNNTSVYGRNRTLDRRLRPFRTPATVAVVAGEVQLPSDMEDLLAVYYTYNGKRTPIRPVDEDRFARIFNDPLAEPIDDDPVYLEQKDSLKVFPETIAQVNMEYLRSPAAPTYNYTVDPTTRRPVFNPTGSVDFDWDQTEEAEITLRILQYAGVSVDDALIIQYTQGKQNTE